MNGQKKQDLKQKSFKKIAITGPESTGKSWLSEQLANYYKTSWVPEYAREYLEMNGLKYTIGDLEKIAKGQLERIESATTLTNEVLFCDTEMAVLKIWSNVVFGNCPLFIEAEFAKQNFDLYLLCYPDIPWEFNPMRENPNNRNYLFSLYEKELISQHFHYKIIKGKGNERLQNALTFVDQIIRK